MSQNTPQKKSDLRIRRTVKHLKEALVLLVLEKGYSAVTVQNMTEQAMVNRATFYRHFPGKYELVAQFVSDFVSDLPPLDIQKLMHNPLEEPPETLRQLARAVNSNAAFFRVMLGKSGTPSFAGQLRSNIERLVVAEFDGLEMAAATVPATLLPSFLASSVVTVLIWCLKQEKLPSEDLMARWFTELVAPGIRTVLGK
jgi:AcrR family transcriptional regulator